MPYLPFLLSQVPLRCRTDSLRQRSLHAGVDHHLVIRYCCGTYLFPEPAVLERQQHMKGRCCQRCTHLIENPIGSVCKLSARVQKWRDRQMALRWTCATAMDATKQFRTLKGDRNLPSLIKALRNHDHHLGLAPQTQAHRNQRAPPFFFNSLRDSARFTNAVR